MAKKNRYTSLAKKGKRYNPYVNKRKGIFYHILSKLSTSVNKKEKNKYSSFIGDFKINMFSISEEVENDYNTYKLKKNNNRKKNARKFSFYNDDGSFNCVGILLGMCCDDNYIREKSVNLFFVNLDNILKSEDFKDLTTFIFSCGVFICLYFTLFFNITEFINQKLSFII